MRKPETIVALVALQILLGCGDDDSGTAGKGNKADASSTADHDAGAKGDASAGDGGGDGGAGSGLTHVDRSGLTDVGTSDPLAYDDPKYWVCRPDMDPNECHRNIDATELLPDGSMKVVKHVTAEKPEFDCFYVYPTVLLNGSANMTDFSQTGVDMVLDPLLSQAAPFTQVCEVYAPLYRQNGLSPGGGPVAGANPALGLQDVRDAFQYYLEHWNKGRKFVLMGHSQGTFMLTQLIAMDVDEKPEVRAQMISALLIGGSITVPEGKLVGGSFKNVPLCSKPAETGCVIAYNSFAKEAPPPATAVFGATSSGMQVACTAPAPLAGNSDKYKGAYLPMHSNNAAFVADEPLPAGVDTPFVLYRDLFRGECVSKDGHNYHEISLDPPAGDKRAEPPYRSSTLDAIGFGLHLVDYNIPLDDLIEAVTRQAAAAR